MPGIHYSPQSQHNYVFPPTPSPEYMVLPATSPVAGGYGASYIPLPSMPCRINSILQTRQLNYDLRLPVENVYRSISPQEMSMPATQPQMPRIIINLPYASDKWQIHIVPTSCPYVTVGDVLYGLYSQLRVAVLDHECTKLFVQSPSHRALVLAAFTARISQLPYQLQPTERKKGTKRIDFLFGKTMFGGLRPVTSRQPDVWELVVS